MRGSALLMLMTVAGGRPAVPSVIPVVTFRATEYAFAGPDSVDAGPTTLRLVNVGHEVHQVSLYRVEQGTTAAAVMRVLIANRVRPPHVTKMGGLEGVAPGDSAFVMLALTPATYVVLCGLPASDGRSHLSKGMMRALVVKPSSAVRRSLPAADDTLRLTEYAFDFSSPLHAGTEQLRVLNGGRQPHNLSVARMHPGKTLADADRWDGKSPPPFDDVGGVAAMDPGEVDVWRATLRPGDYLLSCIVLDATDHRPHFMHGMERLIHVS